MFARLPAPVTGVLRCRAIFASRQITTASSVATPSALPAFARRLSSAAASIEEAYAKPLQWMHWVYATGFITVIGTVKASQNTSGDTFLGSKGETKGTLMLIHKSTAVLLSALLVPRVLLKLVTAAPAHLPGSFLERLGANVSHTALYGFMAAMPATGIAMGWYGGKGVPFYGIYTFPGKADKTKEDGNFAGQMFKWHKWIGQFTYYVVPIHVGAVGFHMLKGQPILARMNPFAAVAR